jgi:CheY-like chemotaxis protein
MGVRSDPERAAGPANESYNRIHTACPAGSPKGTDLTSNWQTAPKATRCVIFLCGIRVVIAILDDEDSVRNALVRLLRTTGFAARGFASADEFLKSWHLDRPHCLLLDLHMPNMSGTEVQQALNMAGANFPVIIITAEDAPSFLEQSMRLGAVAYLRKPLDVAVLLRAVTSAAASLA